MIASMRPRHLGRVVICMTMALATRCGVIADQLAAPSAPQHVIENKGCDTMVNLALA